MYEWIFLIFGLFIGIVLAYLFLKKVYEERFKRWMTEVEESIRKRAVDQSRFSLKGRIWQQILPLIPDFAEKHNLSDCRFIGDPIDYIIFDNYTRVKEREDRKAPIVITFVEVKTGESASLTYEERKIREAVKSGRVRWETIHIRKSSMRSDAS